MHIAASPSPQIRSARMPRLALVEDDEYVRRSMTMLLRARGFHVNAYQSGAEFLLTNGVHGDDCLLIDYKMPRIDGLELIRRLRQSDDETPAIMITGFYSESLRDRALQAGFTDVLEKPSPPTTLVALIRSILGI